MSVIEKTVRIKAPRNVVWRYFSEADLLAAWMMRNNFSGEVGGEFQFFAQSKTEWKGQMDCRLLEFEAPRKIAFTWDTNIIGAETLVTIELDDLGDETEVRLMHANFEQARGDLERLLANHDSGWNDHLAVLRKQAEEEAVGLEQPPGSFDWSEFSLHIAIQAEPDKVIGYWSTPHGMEDFFVEMMRITGPGGGERAGEESAQAGDAFVWRWHSGRRIRGNYLSVEPGKEVGFTFGESKVTVTAAPYRDGTMLRLRQYDIPDTDEAHVHVFTNCRAAWVYFLTVLKVLLEHGIDGRDKSRETGATFSTYFDPSALGVDFN